MGLFGVGEAGVVIADLGQDPGAGECAEAGHSGDDGLVGVLGEVFGGDGGEVFGIGAGGVEGAQQAQGLLAERVLDHRRVVQVVGTKYLVESFSKPEADMNRAVAELTEWIPKVRRFSLEGALDS